MRRKKYDVLFAPMCDRCHRPIVGIGHKDVRVATGPSVYDRRHYGWLCEPCLMTVSMHSKVER